jgi:hypothetical protein
MTDRPTVTPPGVDAPAIHRETNPEQFAPCDSCEKLVDTNDFDWKLVHKVGHDLVICRPCVERSPEDYGY